MSKDDGEGPQSPAANKFWTLRVARPLGDKFAKDPRFQGLSDPETLQYLKALSGKFPVNLDRLWWWESDFSKLTIEVFDSDIRQLSVRLEPQKVLFCPTDDEDGPWALYIVELSDLVEKLSDLHCFEFFVATLSLDLIIFDTHHDDMILVR